MTRILLVRHGHVEGIEPERFRGRTELALTELGRRQAAATAARIAAKWKPAAVWTSPLGRAIETGRVIARQAGVSSLVLEGLNDLDYGAWSWKTHAWAREADRALFDEWFAAPERVRFPGGESLQDLAVRAADVVRKASAPGAGATLVLVGHDSVNKALLMHLLDQPLSAYWRLVQSPCGISEIEIDGARARVIGMNDTAHL
jgi:broad specificity phosphatase PhoE